MCDYTPLLLFPTGTYDDDGEEGLPRPTTKGERFGSCVKHNLSFCCGLEIIFRQINGRAFSAGQLTRTSLYEFGSTRLCTIWVIVDWNMRLADLDWTHWIMERKFTDWSLFCWLIYTIFELPVNGIWVIFDNISEAQCVMVLLLFSECRFTERQFPKWQLPKYPVFPNSSFPRKVFGPYDCHNFIHFKVVNKLFILYSFTINECKNGNFGNECSGSRTVPAGT